MSTDTSDNTPKVSTRRRLLRTVGIVVVAAALLATGYYFIFMRGHVDTDNAYVSGNLVPAAAQTAGTIVAVHVEDTQLVEAGTVIAELDPVDAEVALERAESALARAVREVRGTFASTEGLSALVRMRETEVQRARIALANALEDLKRREDLLQDGGVSTEDVAHARTAVESARAALAAAQAAVVEARQSRSASGARIEGSEVETNPAVLQAAAEMKEAYINLQRTRIVAPVSGVVARRSAQVGARVQPGQALLYIVPVDSLWVDANFKESQLGDVRIGQPVTLRADIYGSAVEYHGRVQGLAAGTGAAFSLLPAQNATGNWIKVVQRVPVRIELDPEELAEHPLRLGLSMTVEIDTRDTSGPLVASRPAAEPVYATRVFDGLEARAEARVREVILANLGARADDRAAKLAARGG